MLSKARITEFISTFGIRPNLFAILADLLPEVPPSDLLALMQFCKLYPPHFRYQGRRRTQTRRAIQSALAASLPLLSQLLISHEAGVTYIVDGTDIRWYGCTGNRLQHKQRNCFA
eukprot:TRINITY_DN8066_c1_g2_i11.p2 TRINITY_DN8066_c1_g2~~TRINITY_DN8066_c1_g2_i11.p2  ORF type:complete len:115 (+),score=2.52 TRINITY_DN8066_c1_g2_i11:176-520(+)